MKNSWLSFSPDSPTRQVLYKTLFIDSLVVTLAIFSAVVGGNSPELHFREEGFITYVSCLQLLIAAVIAGKIFGQVRQSQNAKLLKSNYFWLMVSLGLLFLACDDALEIHEQVDLWLHDIFNLQETAITDLADDIIVGGYLAAFLLYIYTQWQGIAIFRRSFIFFKIGFVLAVVMVILDMASNNNYFTSLMINDGEGAKSLKQWLGAFEDSAKIFAEGIFIVGIYQCRKIAKSISQKKLEYD